MYYQPHQKRQLLPMILYQSHFSIDPISHNPYNSLATSLNLASDKTDTQQLLLSLSTIIADYDEEVDCELTGTEEADLSKGDQCTLRSQKHCRLPGHCIEDLYRDTCSPGSTEIQGT